MAEQWKSEDVTALADGAIGVGLSARLERFKKAVKRQRKLRRSDVVVVSHAKSGRTWLAAMISHVYHQRYGIPEQEIIQFDNFNRLDPRVPRIFFTHDNYKNAAQDPLFSLRDFRGRKTILLVRDPRDVAVSGYFQSRRDRAKSGELTRINAAIYDYMVHYKMPKVIAFLQRWERQISQLENCLVLRYEDLRVQPESELARVFTFMEGRADPSEMAEAVSFASFGSLRKREADGFFATTKLRPADSADESTFKVRRGKVGGYIDYLSAAEAAKVDEMLSRAQLGAFGYLPERQNLSGLVGSESAR